MNKRIILFLVLINLIAATAAARKHKRFKPAIETAGLAIGIGDVDGYPGIALGVAYEHYLTTNGFFTATLAVTGTNGGDIGLGEFGYGDTRSRTNTFSAAPGIRFHPLRNNHRVDIGVSIAAPVGVGGYRTRHMDRSSNITTTKEAGLYAAVLGQLSVSFCMPRHSIFSVFFTGGPVLANTRPYQNYNNAPVFIQAGVCFGNWW